MEYHVTDTNETYQGEYISKSQWRREIDATFGMKVSNGAAQIEAYQLDVLKARGYIKPVSTAASAGGISTADWHHDPATNRQIEYLVTLGVSPEPSMTKGRASQLIDAAKRGDLGSVGGFYRDGSN